MREASRLDAIIARREFRLEWPIRGDFSDRLVRALDDLTNHAGVDRKVDVGVAMKREAPHVGRARGVPGLRLAPLQLLSLSEGQGVRSVTFERRLGEDRRQARDEARLDVLGRDDEIICARLEMARQTLDLAGRFERPAVGVLEPRPPCARKA